METVVKLRLNVDSLEKPSAIERSHQLCEFVEIKRVARSRGQFEVDLNLFTAYDTADPGGEQQMKHVTVSREMVGELFDLLGLFPQAKKRTPTVSEIDARLAEMLEVLCKCDELSDSINLRSIVAQTEIKVRKLQADLKSV